MYNKVHHHNKSHYVSWLSRACANRESECFLLLEWFTTLVPMRFQITTRDMTRLYFAQAWCVIIRNSTILSAMLSNQRAVGLLIYHLCFYTIRLCLLKITKLKMYSSLLMHARCNARVVMGRGCSIEIVPVPALELLASAIANLQNCLS